MKKNKAEKVVKEVSQDIEKKIKRNWKKIIIISAVSLIILIIILLIAGLRIRFSLIDDLVINLEPSDASFTIANNENQKITFSFSTDNSIFCKAKCEYSFYDRSDEKTIDTGNLVLGNKDFFNKTYTLEPKRKGSGQNIYNFDVRCTNINTFFCTTNSVIRQKSSFVTLNYKLSSSEQQIKDSIKEKLSLVFARVNNASRFLQKADYLSNISLIKPDYDNFNNAINKLNILVNQTSYLSNLWSNEEYILLNSTDLTTLSESSEKILLMSSSIFESVLSSIAEQNKLTQQYNSQKNSFFADYYNTTLAYDDFFLVYNQLDSIENKINKGSYRNLFEFENDITNLSDYLAYIKIKSSQDIIKGQNLSSYEYSKKCYIGYCENTTQDVCLDLKKIFSEYENTIFNTSVNVTGLRYYSYVNNSVKILVSDESKEFYSLNCKNYSKPDILDDMPIVSVPVDIATEDIIQNELSENLPICCVYSKCSPCCTTEECMEDPNLYPVLLIHGHSLLRGTSTQPMLDMFNKIQYEMQNDGYLSTGTIYFDSGFYDYQKNEWGLSGYPIVAKASYYYDYFYSLGKYIHITKSVDNIDTYAVRLNEIINLIKYRTGKQKVNIVAHSMGGLVARRYIQIFGENSVNKLILIATPNKGISGTTKSFCTVFGEKIECQDMYDDSILIKKLNDPNFKYSIKVYTISGIGCDTDGSDGDGVVTFESSTIPNATSYSVTGRCDDFYGRGLHNDLLEIDKYPEVYSYINESLKN